MKKQYGIIGWPLGHTMSPTLHNWGFGEHGLNAAYDAFPLEPGDLARFMRTVRERPIAGMSVTIPHKRTVMEYLDRISERARAVGAVNTVYWDGDALCGENTDVSGLIAPLKTLDSLPDSAIVLGAGGAARAALVGLRELGLESVFIANRTEAKARALADEFSVEAVAWDERTRCGAALICNTTPLGMAGDMESLTPWGPGFPSGGIAYDIVYNPLETRFLREAAQAGCATLSGLEMFLHQGLAQFRLWTGVDLDEDKARALLLEALAGQD